MKSGSVEGRACGGGKLEWPLECWGEVCSQGDIWCVTLRICRLGPAE